MILKCVDHFFILKICFPTLLSFVSGTLYSGEVYFRGLLNYYSTGIDLDLKCRKGLFGFRNIFFLNLLLNISGI